MSEPPGDAIVSSATEVDALLEAVMVRMHGSPIVEEQMSYYAEHIQVGDDLAWRSARPVAAADSWSRGRV
jgi:hypothetical protein